MQLQYIGARYVPIWYQNSLDDSANWEVNVEYEPLTFVTTANNHLYLSKKTVPDNIGSPADNTEYWLDLGVFISGQYELLQNQIDDMKDGDVPGSLQDQINDTNDRIDDAESYALYLGNSYTQGGGSTSGTDGIYSKTASKLFDHAYMYQAPGAGFLAYTGHSSTFETMLDQAIANTAIDKSKITDLVLVSAWGESNSYQVNGASYESLLRAALTSFMEKVRNNFTNPHLRVTVTGVEIRGQRVINGISIGTSYYYSPFGVHNVLQRVLPEYGIEYLGWVGFNAFMRPDCVASDKYHPNDLGYEILSTEFMNAYRGDFQYKQIHQKVRVEYYLEDGSGYAELFQTPDKTIVKFRPFSVSSGDTPVQYTDQPYLIFNDSDATHIVPALPDGYELPLGDVIFWLPNHNYQLEIDGKLAVSNLHQVYIGGNTYTPTFHYSARHNASLSLKELIIEHF